MYLLNSTVCSRGRNNQPNWTELNRTEKKVERILYQLFWMLSRNSIDWKNQIYTRSNGISEVVKIHWENSDSVLSVYRLPLVFFYFCFFGWKFIWQNHLSLFRWIFGKISSKMRMTTRDTEDSATFYSSAGNVTCQL